ncbi:TetR/AcrR family transcriptional regulator [Parvularcula sp. IMCC14364]|uniref:TetR/AcrR family transcriptional regulator n=1 Tax=Parvularcula sp. IMCC14364 TaxID=3067902 RepID=UPI0027408F04|nr:TetR/AcrR family transcriptional regulator [Parvularcula sp. IMCC14364]
MGRTASAGYGHLYFWLTYVTIITYYVSNDTIYLPHMKQTSTDPTAIREHSDQRLARGARSREKILEAALDILGTSGYGALSISAVCKQAGVSATSLYHHFGDKAGLLSAMIDEAFTRNERHYIARIEQMQSPLEQLDAFMTSVRDVFTDDSRNSGAILAALSQARGNSSDIAQVIGEARQRMWILIAERFAQYFRIENGIVLTHIFTAFSSYIPQVRQDPDSDGKVEALIDTLRTVLLVMGAVIQPDMMKDENYAAAVAKARQKLLQNDEAHSSPCSIVTLTEKTHDQYN